MEFKREKYLETLINRQQNGLIKVITGMRRCGKSYLMNEIFYRYLLGQQVREKNIIRFAFDIDEDLDKLDDFYPNEPTRLKQSGGFYTVNAKKFRAYIANLTQDGEQYYLLLDEVQMLDNFVSTLNGFLRHRNFDVYVTGSNSRFLSSDIATEFKGRSSVIHVLPLTFGEYFEEIGLNKEEAWRNYVVTGGIPLVAAMSTREEQTEYLKNLCQETYLKDIIARNHIRKKEELGDIFNILASVIGSPMNSTKIVNTFRSVQKKSITDDTMARYLDYFQDAFLISKAQKYNIKGRAYINSPYKLYFEDVGVRNAQLNFRQIDEGHLMENILYNELRYRGYNVDVGEVKVSEKTDRVDKNGKAIYAEKALEVDFIATRGDEKLYLQSSLDMSTESKVYQEKRSLYYVGDSFQKLVVTKNGLDPSTDEHGVTTVDLFDFLLSSNLLSLN